MICACYDDETDQIYVTGEDHSYAPRSLVATIEPDGKIGIRLKMAPPGLLMLKTPFANLMDANGSSFASSEEAKAYLDGEFAKWRDETRITLPTAEPIGGHKAVRIVSGGQARIASADDASQAGTALGVSLTAADERGSIDVRILGEVAEGSWSWAPGPVFLGLNGALVQTPPASGFVQQIGTATSPTTLVVALSTPIVLAQ